jgi:hypothetical protein
MATSFQITIPKPCHADWASMTPETQGRFCAACQKCVVDMTAKAPAEIADIYQQHGGNVCGRVRSTQISPEQGRRISRPVQVPKASLRQLAAQTPSPAWSRLRRFAFALLMAFGFFQAGQAQTDPTPVKMGKIHVVETPARQLSGTVYDENGEPAPHATVRLEGENGQTERTTTDRKGHYTLTGKWRGDYTLTARVGREDSYAISFTFSNYDDAETWDITQDLRVEYEQHFIMGDMMVEPVEPIEPIEPIRLIDPPLVEAPTLVSGQKEALTLSEFSFTAYPNPATDHLLLVTNAATRQEAHVKVFDLHGNLLEDRTWDVFASPAHVIELNQRAAGVYLLHVSTTETDVLVRRFVKQ